MCQSDCGNRDSADTPSRDGPERIDRPPGARSPLKQSATRADPTTMRQTHAETGGDENEAPESPWIQLGLEAAVLCGIAVLLLVVATRVGARPDANILLGIGVVLHAAGLIRLASRIADRADRDATE